MHSCIARQIFLFPNFTSLISRDDKIHCCLPSTFITATNVRRKNGNCECKKFFIISKLHLDSIRFCPWRSVGMMFVLTFLKFVVISEYFANPKHFFTLPTRPIEWFSSARCDDWVFSNVIHQFLNSTYHNNTHYHSLQFLAHSAALCLAPTSHPLFNRLSCCYERAYFCCLFLMFIPVHLMWFHTHISACSKRIHNRN